ncbi:MAG: PQQ-binding-like beta-propeller repeat protein [Planctomycetia bacterium]|jgi:outer membrane protein assembly factor BamB
MNALTNISKAIVLPALFLGSFAFAEDWAGFRNSDRSGTSKEIGLLPTWPKEGPKLAWTFKNAGTGYSGPAIVGNHVFIMGARNGNELLFKLDPNGKELWALEIGKMFDFSGNTFSGGPNATPMVDGELVFGLGSQGVLICCESKTGKLVWKKDLPKEMGAEVNNIGGAPEKMGWGYCWSPIVDGENLICVPGGKDGTLAALDKKTGKEIWRSKEANYQGTYASPIIANIHGAKTIVQMTPKGAIGVDARNGKLLWDYKREKDYPDVVCPTPIVKGNMVIISAGFSATMDGILIEKSSSNSFEAKKAYEAKEISNDNGGLVMVGKHVFGFHLKRAWECVDAETGKVVWTSPRRALGAGSVIAADGRLYVVTEDAGEVAMLAGSPDGYKEISKFTLPEGSKLKKSRGRIWTHPVISDGKLYVRDQELLFCFEIK